MPAPTQYRARELDDVVRARAAARTTVATYGPRRSRTLAGTWADFAARYGWRAYALPVLVAVTIIALTSGGAAANRVGRSVHRPVAGAPAPKAAQPSAPQPPVASGSMALKNDAGTRANTAALAAAALPAGPAYTAKGQGTFRVLPGTAPKVGSGPLFRYDIEVENGITGIDLAQFQRLVVSTLSDKRSWSGHGVTLQRVDSGPVNFRVSLTSSLTVRKVCGYDVPVETSCYAAAGPKTPVNRVVLNDARWMRGGAAYVGNVAFYRLYMINHEDGHALGHMHAHQCLPGGLAPVMMQQTFGLRSAVTGKFCQANPWPYPPGAKGAPGAEQPDTNANDEYHLGD